MRGCELVHIVGLARGCHAAVIRMAVPARYSDFHSTQLRRRRNGSPHRTLLATGKEKETQRTCDHQSLTHLVRYYRAHRSSSNLNRSSFLSCDHVLSQTRPKSATSIPSPDFERLGAVELLDRFVARREQTCGRVDVDVRDQHPFSTVWLVAEQRPVGPHHRRSGLRPGACTVYGCEIAGVLGGATQDCFLMERVCGVGETRGHVTARLGYMEMRVEHDVCAVPDGAPGRFRIAQTLMADRDTKCQRTGLENPPPGTRRIGTFLGGVDLNFVLETGDRSVSIDDQCGG